MISRCDRTVKENYVKSSRKYFLFRAYGTRLRATHDNQSYCASHSYKLASIFCTLQWIIRRIMELPEPLL
jgi:hypothetical protein